MRTPLTNDDYVRAADVLRCDVAAIKAVASIEAPFGGFLLTGEPTALFERHWFHKLTNGKYDKIAPDLSSPNPGGYTGGIREQARIARAAALDRTAALESASWGKFQIMGFNYKLCHMATLQDFINMVYKDEQSQLQLFVNFMLTKNLPQYLAKLDFDGFAYHYNGPDYQKYSYATKMARYYTQFKIGTA